LNLGYIIRNVDGDGERILDIPKGWWDHSVAWLDNDESVLICAFDDVDHIRDPDRSMQLYRYDLATDEITQLTQDLEYKMHVDWISDLVSLCTPCFNRIHGPRKIEIITVGFNGIM